MEKNINTDFRVKRELTPCIKNENYLQFLISDLYQ